MGYVPREGCMYPIHCKNHETTITYIHVCFHVHSHVHVRVRVHICTCITCECACNTCITLCYYTAVGHLEDVVVVLAGVGTTPPRSNAGRPTGASSRRNVGESGRNSQKKVYCTTCIYMTVCTHPSCTIFSTCRGFVATCKEEYC